MYKILYLHGLESKQGGEKIDFLSSKAIVHAPSLNYKDKDIFNQLVKMVVKVDPDIIIGSSMGGYVGWVLGSMFKKQTLLFNPALHSRTIEIPHLVNSSSPRNPIIILGEQDEIINSSKTIDYLNNSNVVGAIVEMVEMKHRVDFNIFKNIYNKYFE